MRKLKFRVWNSKSQKMYYNVHIDKNGHANDGTSFLTYSDEDNIMQFIGIKDSKGGSIFEGDIINGNHKDLFVIENINGCPQMYNIKYIGQDDNQLISECTGNPQSKAWLQCGEIIGNIYENIGIIEIG